MLTTQTMYKSDNLKICIYIYIFKLCYNFAMKCSIKPCNLVQIMFIETFIYIQFNLVQW